MNIKAADISVVVRTAGRSPIFLERALHSIKSQTRLPAAVIISVDGGDLSTITSVLTTINFPDIVIELHPIRTSAAAAANRGVARSSSTWVTFLDDDDTWHPQFIEHVSYLVEKTAMRKDVAGFVTHTQAIYEKFDGNRITKRGAEPFNCDLQVVDLASLAVGNIFTNNAFVFERRVFDLVGGYDTSLRSLEDWDFNIRFAQHSDIEVLPKMLANYHHRTSDSVDGNSGRSMQLFEMTRMKNSWLRSDLAQGRFGLGYLSIIGEIRGAGAQLSRFAKYQKWLRAILRFGRKK